MTQSNPPLPDPQDPMVELILRHRLTDIRTAIDNKDAHGILVAIENLGRELHPDLANKVLSDLLELGVRTLVERIGGEG